MRIATWNVNGIRAVHRKGLFEPFIAAEDPDIICLQETKAMQGQSELDLPQYEEYWNSAVKKGYSGTAIFTKIKPISVRNDIPAAIVKKYGLKADKFGDPNTEGRVLAAEFDSFWLVTVYTPNAKGSLERLPLRAKHWDAAFLAYVKELESSKPVIFCGDLNAAHTHDDLAHPEANDGEAGFTEEERAGIEAILSAGYVDAFRLFTQGKGHYTWWSNFTRARERNVGWRIDYFFVSSKLSSKIKACTIENTYMGSDHCPVLLDISVKK